MKNVHESKFTREAPVFERMCDVEVSVIPSEVVPHPTSVIVDVRSVGMTFHIPVSLFGHRVRSVLLRARGTVRRDVLALGLMLAAISVFLFPAALLAVTRRHNQE